MMIMMIIVIYPDAWSGGYTTGCFVVHIHTLGLLWRRTCLHCNTSEPLCMVSTAKIKSMWVRLKMSGWWLEHVLFHILGNIGNNHPNWLIFFRGVQTTNLINYIFLFCFLINRKLKKNGCWFPPSCIYHKPYYFFNQFSVDLLSEMSAQSRGGHVGKFLALENGSFLSEERGL
jgi:hypothetical protein